MVSPESFGRIRGKVAIVTGGACGIGRATALLFAREGARVLIADRNETTGRETESEISSSGGRAIFERADVTQDADCRRVVDRAVREFGAIHILFNNFSQDGTRFTTQRWFQKFKFLNFYMKK